MTIIEKTYKIKTFDEFSADEQAEIIERHRYINVDDGFSLTDWNDSYYLSIENAGFKNPKIYYDLSYSQGSGACFDSKDLDFNIILKSTITGKLGIRIIQISQLFKIITNL